MVTISLTPPSKKKSNTHSHVSRMVTKVGQRYPRPHGSGRQRTDLRCCRARIAIFFWHFHFFTCLLCQPGCQRRKIVELDGCIRCRERKKVRLQRRKVPTQRSATRRIIDKDINVCPGLFSSITHTLQPCQTHGRSMLHMRGAARPDYHIPFRQKLAPVIEELQNVHHLIKEHDWTQLHLHKYTPYGPCHRHFIRPHYSSFSLYRPRHVRI